MSQATLQKSDTEIISVKVAATLVPYSRDYIARIAREGKIVAVQIDRQWFVERTALINFYEQALIEESVRKQHLSLKRKLELQIKERHQDRLQILAEKRMTGSVQAALLTAFILFGGISTACLFLGNFSSSSIASVISSQTQTLPAIDIQAQPFILVDYLDAPADVLETTKPLSLDGGIVLLPSNTTKMNNEIADFFSDDVEINMTSTSSGMISTEQNGIKTELPFVRIPNASQSTVTPSVP